MHNVNTIIKLFLNLNFMPRNRHIFNFLNCIFAFFTQLMASIVFFMILKLD